MGFKFVEYLLFVGSGLYIASSVVFFYLFLRTLKTKDGVGLVFLKYLTLGLSIGSITIFTIRILSEYFGLPFLTARAIAIVNPMLLVTVALYLNYLFHKKQLVNENEDSKNIKTIKKDVKIVKEGVQEIIEK